MRQAISSKKLPTEKVVMLGAASTGKTSIVNRYISNQFSDSNESTIGAAFASKIIKNGDREINLEIWDTGGSEKYRSLAPMYYRDTNSAIIVFDLTSKPTLRAAQDWLNELHEKGPPFVHIALAGNKADLISQKEIQDDTIQEFLDFNQISIYKETSAQNGSNIQELFTELIETSPHLKPSNKSQTIVDNTPLEGDSSNKKDSCC